MLIALTLIATSAFGQSGQYVNVPYWFVQIMEGQQKGVNIFNARQSLQGDWFVDPNTMTDFKNNFQQLYNAGWTADTSTMLISDFPQDTVLNHVTQ